MPRNPRPLTMTLTAILVVCLSSLVGCGAPPAETQTSGTAAGGGAAIAHLPRSWPYPLDAPAASGEHGMVVTDAPLATEVGVEVLRSGGNAVDAAVTLDKRGEVGVDLEAPLRQPDGRGQERGPRLGSELVVGLP